MSHVAPAATINVFVKLRNDNITFIDFAIVSLAINITGRVVVYSSFI